MPTGAPEAELWLGTHPASPAVLTGGGGELASLSGPLPFLLKILSAAAPLSLQAHPNAAQAAAGYAREEEAGIPADADERNYKDPSPKPELLYALTPFWALSGFRPVAETRAVLEPVSTRPAIARLLYRLNSDADLGPAVGWLLSDDPGAAEVVSGATTAAAELKGPSWDVVRLLASHYPGDPGVAISLLLHPVVLRPGEALYLPAGNLHAYLGGTGIELMGPSDNVLRGGLTEKHMDVPELLAVLDARPMPVPVLPPGELEPGVYSFAPQGAGFRLFVVEASALRRGTSLPVTGSAIALALGGDVEINDRQLPAGAAAFAHERQGLAVRGSGLLVVAAEG